MAVIPIDERYRISSDERNWSIDRPRKRHGEMEWVAFQFYPTLVDAINGLIRWQLMTSEVVGLEALRDELKRIEEDVKRKAGIDV